MLAVFLGNRRLLDPGRLFLTVEVVFLTVVVRRTVVGLAVVFVDAGVFAAAASRADGQRKSYRRQGRAQQADNFEGPVQEHNNPLHDSWLEVVSAL